MSSENVVGETGIADIRFVDADEPLRERMTAIHPRWAKCLCIESGFSVVAVHGARPVGIISVKWKELPPPLPPAREGYINIIEVKDGYRRRGIARKLVELSLAKARAEGAAQLRAWSTNDKTEAIPIWKTLGFALCPATHSMWKTEVTGYFVAKRVD